MIPEQPIGFAEASGMLQDFAQWLVHANVDLRHPPCDPEWNLEAIVGQVR